MSIYQIKQIMISNESQQVLIEFGNQLRKLRIERNDRQSDFAARLGVSVPTLRKLEQGDPTVAIGTWVDAIWILGRIEGLKEVLTPAQSLFDRWEQSGDHKGVSQTRPRTRKRANRR